MRIGVGVLAAVVLLALGLANYRFSTEYPGGNDFLARWVGARYWMQEDTSPYDPQVTLAAQRLIYGRPANTGEDVAHFVYPMPAMVFFAPFGLLDYPLARAIWMTLLELGLPLLAIMGLAIAGWRPRRPTRAVLLLFAVIWYHGLRAVIVGQFAVIEAVLMIGALLATQRREDAVAGVLLGLSIAKPQMPVLLIPFVLLWAARSRRWSIVIGFLGTVGVLVIGFALLLPGWPMMWLQQLIEYPSYTELGPPVSILTSLLPRGGEVAAIGLGGLALLYLFWEWSQAMGRSDRWFQWTCALTIVITNLVAIRTATTNYVVMLPALYLVYSVWAERWGGAGQALILISTAALLVGLWLIFASTVAGNVEAPIMYLPLPIIVLISLWWTRWWAVRELPQ